MFDSNTRHLCLCQLGFLKIEQTEYKYSKYKSAKEAMQWNLPKKDENRWKQKCFNSKDGVMENTFQVHSNDPWCFRKYLSLTWMYIFYWNYLFLVCFAQKWSRNLEHLFAGWELECLTFEWKSENSCCASNLSHSQWNPLTMVDQWSPQSNPYFLKMSTGWRAHDRVCAASSVPPLSCLLPYLLPARLRLPRSAFHHCLDSQM